MGLQTGCIGLQPLMRGVGSSRAALHLSTVRPRFTCMSSLRIASRHGWQRGCSSACSLPPPLAVRARSASAVEVSCVTSALLYTRSVRSRVTCSVVQRACSVPSEAGGATSAYS